MKTTANKLKLGESARLIDDFLSCGETIPAGTVVTVMRTRSYAVGKSGRSKVVVTYEMEGEQERLQLPLSLTVDRLEGELL